MKSRGFFIRNFRNIGVCKDESQGVFLRLSGLEKENMGGLVIILGENNTGKSNLLEALAKFKKYRENPLSEKDSHAKFKKDCENPLSEKDSPSFLEYANCLPEIELSYRIPAYYIHYPQDVIKKGSMDFKAYINKLQEYFDYSEIYIEHNKQDNKYKIILKNQILGDRFMNCTAQPLECLNDHSLSNAIVDKSKPLRCKFVVGDDIQGSNTQNFIDYIDSEQQIISSFAKDYKVIISLDKDKKIQQKYCITNVVTEKDRRNIFMASYQPQKAPNVGLKTLLIPQIIFYKETSFDNIDLITTPDTIADSLFFQSLFKNISDDIQNTDVLKTIQGAYKESKKRSNTGYYDKVAEDINNKLQKIDQHFNALYGKTKKEEGVYCFKIKLEDKKISLNIFKNRQPLNLDEQSAGFRKFFNFFFGFIHAHKLKEGDIVLIDEVETHLSVPAQREFRNFLKEFGQKTGILFVVSTHSPFMLDMQHLDEVRILKTKDDGLGIEIINDFYFIASKNQANTLLEMKEALGVDYCHLLNPKSKPIFVEGITDYNYLTAFALLYVHDRHKDLQLTFLPINGLGRNSNDHKEVMQAVIDFGGKLGESPAVLLVDKDWAGEDMEKHAENEENLRIVKLNDVSKLSGENKNQNILIEDLFSEKDKNIFGISKNNKGSLQSSYFKCKIKLFIDEQSKKGSERKNTVELNIGKETKDNFYAVLEYLHEKANGTSEGTIVQVTHSLSRSE